MPFTTSHAAAVLPIKQIFGKSLSLTGLMAGSMSPDLIYFLMLRTDYRGFSHSWNGLFIFCLPAGIVFSILFHRYFKYQFIRNLPSPLDNFLSGLAQSPWNLSNFKDWIVLIISVLIGALTHFGWDAVTHPGGEIVEMFPFLNEQVNFLGRPRYICRIIQHASTLLGVLIIVLYAIFGHILPQPQNKEVKVDRSVKIKYWFMCVLFSSTLSVAVFLYYNWLLKWDFIEGHYFIVGITTLSLGIWAGMFWWSIYYGWLTKKPKYENN